MQCFQGRGVSGGIAIGKARALAAPQRCVTRSRIDDPASELLRFEAAREAAMASLDTLYQKALVEVGESGAQIFAIHRMMLEDEDYLDCVKGIITAQTVNAEYAVAVASDRFAAMLAGMEDGYIEARASDVRDISERLLAALSGGSSDPDPADGMAVICAEDLTPSQTVALDKSRVLAFVTASGSPNSHTAILARAMNIPAVIGVGSGFLDAAKDGVQLIVDGSGGEVLLAPSADALEDARSRQAELSERARLLSELRGKENVTRDGHRIEIFANIGSADEIGEVFASDAGGIGLFRSEFLYLEAPDPPDEERQFGIYRRVLESMSPKKVVIRTVDIGADKKAPCFDLEKEENPALGLRGIRLCLARPEILHTQLRALFRASAFGRLAILFPMIASEWEVLELRHMAVGVQEELRREGIDISPCVELGIMIETPAAALIGDRLAPLVDFFSVGTNDLTQYTLACDRQNPALERYADPRHEAVLRLIGQSADAIHRTGGWIGICGELAADTALTERFLRMGIDELSVSPPFVLPLRETVRGLDLGGE